MKTSRMNDKERARRKAALRRQRKRRKLILAAASLMALALTAALATRAYLSKVTDPVTNTLTAGKVEASVDESFDKTTKKNVAIKNTGNVTAYIRAKVIVSWMSEDGTEVYAQSPEEGTDYTISYDGDSSWQQAADGFWYYTQPVDDGDETGILIKEAKLADGVTPPAGYTLSIEIAASALQSLPTSTVSDTWTSGVDGVNSDGSLKIKVLSDTEG